MKTVVGILCLGGALGFAYTRGVNWESLVAIYAGVVACLMLVAIPRIVAVAFIGSLSGLAALAAGGLEVWNWAAFGTVSIHGAPPKIHWCGHNYAAAKTTVTLTAASAASQYPDAFSAGTLHLMTVGSTPSAAMILSGVTCNPAALPPRLYIAAQPAGAYTLYNALTGSQSTGIHPGLPPGITIPTNITIPPGLTVPSSLPGAPNP